jgi:hypothetical protein
MGVVFKDKYGNVEKPNARRLTPVEKKQLSKMLTKLAVEIKELNRGN